MAMKNDVNVPLLVVIVIVSGLILLVTTVAVDAWYKSVEAQEIEQKWDQSPNTWLADLRQQQLANLQIDQRINRQHYHVPVTEAMRILAEHNGDMSK